MGNNVKHLAFAIFTLFTTFVVGTPLFGNDIANAKHVTLNLIDARTTTNGNTDADTSSLSLCDDHWNGNCHEYDFTYGECFSLSDGIVAKAGNGVSSVWLIGGEQCWFYSGLDCGGDLVLAASQSIHYLQPPADNNIYSFNCFHSQTKRSFGKRDAYDRLVVDAKDAAKSHSAHINAIETRDNAGYGGIALCDDQWSGNCRGYGFVDGDCNSLLDGIVAKQSNGVSSMVLLEGEVCSFWSALGCVGDLVLATDHSIFALEPPADDNIYSFMCTHEKKRSLEPKAALGEPDLQVNSLLGLTKDAASKVNLLGREEAHGTSVF
jgi:hypothetical protein